MPTPASQPTVPGFRGRDAGRDGWPNPAAGSSPELPCPTWMCRGSLVRRWFQLAQAQLPTCPSSKSAPDQNKAITYLTDYDFGGYENDSGQTPLAHVGDGRPRCFEDIERTDVALTSSGLTHDQPPPQV